jgi:hypothetical protein
MTVDHVFPEDEGTGATEGDDADAANFGAHAQHDNLSDYIAGGLSFQNIDYTNLNFDVTAGKAFLEQSSATTAQSGENRDQGVLFEVEVSARSGLALTDSAVNEVFVDVDLSTDDSVTINVIDDGTSPQAPFLKIGEIDTTVDTSNEDFNRAPSMTATSLSAPSTRSYLDLTGNDLRLGTDKRIQDGTGDARFGADSVATKIYTENGDPAIWFEGGNKFRYFAQSGVPWVIEDEQGAFDAVEYNTGASFGNFDFLNARARFRAEIGTSTIAPDHTARVGSYSGDVTQSLGILFANDNGTDVGIHNESGSLKIDGDAPNLRLVEEQAIEDDTGENRMFIGQGATILYDETGTAAHYFEDGDRYRVRPNSTTPWVVEDAEGTFNAVQYITSASPPGLLRLNNAELEVLGYDIRTTSAGSTHTSYTEPDNATNDTGGAAITEFNAATGGGADSYATIAYQERNGEVGAGSGNLYFTTSETSPPDWSGGNTPSSVAMVLINDGTLDLSPGQNNLRLATGQSIEDGGENNRIDFRSSDTLLRSENGQVGIILSKGEENRIDAYSDTPFRLLDREGSFDAVQYDTDPSTGTLELTNAVLDANASGSVSGRGNTAIRVGAVDAQFSKYLSFVNDASNESPVSLRNDDGSLVGEDPSGNVTTVV